MILPHFYQVRQSFDQTRLLDVAGAVRAELAKFTPGDRVKPGQNVAVAAGSRGIRNLGLIVATVVQGLKDMGLQPFVIPAMGSHGRATAEGQKELLAELGVTEEAVGAPVKSSLDTVSLGRVETGAEVFCAKDALEADHLVVVNRIKPHTAFRNAVESGLCKMLAVGLGKQRGASNMHKYDLARTIVPAARRILERAPVLFGLGIVENSADDTHTVRLARPEEFPKVDEELLALSWTFFPRLPLDDLDILIIDEMGKNISGAGIDPNVVGFWRREGGLRKPDFRVIIVLDLTPESHGNATGIALADLTTRRVRDMIDLEATYMNALTSWVLRSAKLPIPLENDRAAVEKAVSQVPDQDRIRLARIKNSLEIETFWVTEEVLPELEKTGRVEIDRRPLTLEFDYTGRIRPFAH